MTMKSLKHLDLDFLVPFLHWQYHIFIDGRDQLLVPMSDTISLIFFSVKDFFLTPPPNQNRLLVQPAIPESLTSSIHKLSTENLATAAEGEAKEPDEANDPRAATETNSRSRLEQLMPSLLRHVHEFCEENKVTVEEWKAAMSFLESHANDRQQLRGIPGMDVLIDNITQTLASKAVDSHADVR